MTQLKALIFDVDGTMAETERDGHRVAFNRAFADIGLDWYWDTALYGELLAVTGGKERIRYYLSQYEQEFECHGDIDDLIVQLHADKTKHYLALLHSHKIKLRSGVARLLHSARSHGLILAIATTTTQANVHALITSNLGAEAIHWFDCIAAGDVVQAKKPAPDIFQYCLQQLKLKPEQCLVIEDSMQGAQAATAAGIATLVTVNDYTRQDDFSGVIAVFDQLGDFNGACQQLAGHAINADYIEVKQLIELHEHAQSDK